MSKLQDIINDRERAIEEQVTRKAMAQQELSGQEQEQDDQPEQVPKPKSRKTRKTGKKEPRQGQAPSFNEHGKVKRPGRKKAAKIIILIAGILAALAMIIYLPQYFSHEKDTAVSGNLPVNGDAITVISKANAADWLEDYDGDGLDNQEETNFMTDQYNIDTDSDCITDSAEVYVTKTSPVTYDDTVLSNCILNDELQGINLSTPYKIGNVIVWADDYPSKAYGSVIETSNGYRFCYFSGYVQFSLYDGWYAYKVNNGVHQLLPYREQENVWHVSAGDEVELYQQPLEERICLGLFGSLSYLEINAVTRFLADFLPDKGFITAYPLTNADLGTNGPEVHMANLKPVPYQADDPARFTKNCNSMSDIMYVRDMIDADRCVGVTIFHESVGEKCGIVYGYYDDNTLLVADPATLEYVGNIQVQERARMMVTESGETVSYEYFVFDGFGASSEAGFRINFFE